MLHIRPACPDDAPGIAQIHVRAWHETYAGLVPDDYLATLSVEKRLPQWQESIRHTFIPSSKHGVFVAEDDLHQVVGFCSGGFARQLGLGYDAELYALYLLKIHHGAGTGARLFRELLDFLKKQGFKRMMLWMLEDNPTAQFYDRMGGKRLEQTEEVEFGSAKLLERAYGWDLTSRQQSKPKQA